MSTSGKPAKSARIVDVAHPGKSVPSVTSKPVIVSNRPILKDPMMVDEAVAENEQETPVQSGAPSLPKTQLTPLDDKTEEAPKADVAEAADQPADIKDEKSEPLEQPETPKLPEPEVDPIPEQPKPELDEPEEDEPTKGDEGVPDVHAVEAAAADADAKKEAAIQKLVEEKKYELPINAVGKRKTRRFVILGILLSVLLILAWINIALDAGLIELGNVRPVTRFFSN